LSFFSVGDYFYSRVVVAVCHFNRIVAGAVIDDQQLPCGVGLPNDRMNGLINGLFAIVHRHSDADKWGHLFMIPGIGDQAVLLR
jgi:hypothetical protein